MIFCIFFIFFPLTHEILALLRSVRFDPPQTFLFFVFDFFQDMESSGCLVSCRQQMERV
jgi:hypothetical protein